MTKEEINCEADVIRTSSIRGPKGILHHYTWYSGYSPEKMLACTPMSRGSESHYSVVNHRGITAIFSCHEKSEASCVYYLSLSRGSRRNREAVKKEFRRQLGIEAKVHSWLSISPIDVDKGDMYCWKVLLV